MDRSKIQSILVAAAIVLLLAPAAMAQQSTVAAIGPRVGFSVSPDQFVFGGHLLVGPVAPSLMFAPSLEVGVGDNRTVVSGNFDLQYHFAVRESAWHPYMGAGMGVNNENMDESFGGTSDTNVGGNIIFGAMAPTTSGNRFFSELKLGLGDIPDMKLMAGWHFPL